MTGVVSWTEEAFGRVKLFRGFDEDGGPVLLEYWVKELQSWGCCPVGYPQVSRQFYAIYLTTETRPRTRLQSFNTDGWPDSSHQGRATLRGYDVEAVEKAAKIGHEESIGPLREWLAAGDLHS